MNIIASYAGTVFTGAVVLAAVIGAVRQILKDRKNGTLCAAGCTGCHCHGGCSGCGGVTDESVFSQTQKTPYLAAGGPSPAGSLLAHPEQPGLDERSGCLCVPPDPAGPGTAVLPDGHLHHGGGVCPGNPAGAGLRGMEHRRLPFTDGLLSTDRTLFPSYTAGVYEENGSCLFVTRGLGNSGPTFRLFNRPEVAAVTLHKG